MGLYQNVIDKVSKGARFSVDFKKRILRLNGKKLDLNGDLGIQKYEDLDDWLNKVEDLYDDYKYSRPTKTSMEKARKSKFKALTPIELVQKYGHEALNNPQGRDEAQVALEAFIVLSLINGSFKPEELFYKDWFYKGSDGTLIIQKNWF